MEVCCLKMASRCRPSRAIQMDVSRIPTMSSSHDCGSLSRVVMVRKTDQRMINHKSPRSDPQCELVTFETIQTYRGHKPDHTVVFKETHDFPESEAQRSPTAQRFLKSQLSSGIQSMTISTSDVSRIDRCSPVRSITPNFSVRHKSPSPLSQKGSFSSTFSDLERECLKAHNDFRAKHGGSPLKLNKKLCRFAEEWAKIIASRGTPAHRNNSPYGENIFCSWSSCNNVVVKGWEPVEHWYSEGDTHCFGREPSTLKTGHFTQVVWKDSREVGVGPASNRSGQVFIVANYDPPGNFIGSFAENVLPITSQTPTPQIFINGISEDSTDSLLTDSSQEDGDLDRFVNAILRYHNEFRKKHGAPELKLNKNLRSISQDWAETLAREDRFAYRPNTNYGENIYCLWSSDRNAKANPKNVCRSWYDEVKEFNFGVEPKGMFKAGHFSQMVWKSSKELGVGVAKTKKGKVLVVCNYEPRGNVVGYDQMYGPGQGPGSAIPSNVNIAVTGMYPPQSAASSYGTPSYYPPQPPTGGSGNADDPFGNAQQGPNTGPLGPSSNLIGATMVQPPPFGSLHSHHGFGGPQHYQQGPLSDPTSGPRNHLVGPTVPSEMGGVSGGYRPVTANQMQNPQQMNSGRGTFVNATMSIQHNVSMAGGMPYGQSCPQPNQPVGSGYVVACPMGGAYTGQQRPSGYRSQPGGPVRPTNSQYQSFCGQFPDSTDSVPKMSQQPIRNQPNFARAKDQQPDQHQMPQTGSYDTQRYKHFQQQLYSINGSGRRGSESDFIGPPT